LARRAYSDDLHLSAGAALAIDHLPAFLRLHPGAKPDVPGPLYLAGLVGVMHESFLLDK
jgi:hypothetical protein